MRERGKDFREWHICFNEKKAGASGSNIFNSELGQQQTEFKRKNGLESEE